MNPSSSIVAATPSWSHSRIAVRIATRRCISVDWKATACGACTTDSSSTRADAGTIPDTFSLDSPGRRYEPAYLHYQAHHLLIADNVLDFSHLSYVHEKTLGGSPAIAGTRAQVDKLPNGVHIHREVKDTAPSPLHRSLGMPDGEVDRWWTYDYTLPGLLLLDSGVRPANGADGRRLHFHSCQAIVPESATTSHYFFMQAHGFDLENARLTQSLYQGVLTAFHEDKTMIESQAALIAQSPPVAMIGLPMDAALVQYRRLYEQALAAENKPRGNAS